METTHDKVRPLVEMLEGAMVRLRNSEMDLTDDPGQDFDAWDQMVVAANLVEDASTILAQAVRDARNAAEEALPE